jgi:hypothetical protein
MNAALILQLVAQLPGLIEAGIDVANLATKAQSVLSSGKEPTADDFVALNSEIEGLLAQLNKDPPAS